jgi:hypothetical protein
MGDQRFTRDFGVDGDLVDDLALRQALWRPEYIGVILAVRG